MVPAALLLVLYLQPQHATSATANMAGATRRPTSPRQAATGQHRRRTGAAWSGPRVAPAFTPSGVAAITIDGVASAPSYLVGNTQGGLDDDLPAWRVELLHAREASGDEWHGVMITSTPPARPQRAVACCLV